MTDEKTSELSKIKQEICSLVILINLNRREIEEMQEEVEQLYKELRQVEKIYKELQQCEGEAA